MTIFSKRISGMKRNEIKCIFLALRYVNLHDVSGNQTEAWKCSRILNSKSADKNTTEKYNFKQRYIGLGREKEGKNKRKIVKSKDMLSVPL